MTKRSGGALATGQNGTCRETGFIFSCSSNWTQVYLKKENRRIECFFLWGGCDQSAGNCIARSLQIKRRLHHDLGAQLSCWRDVSKLLQIFILRLTLTFILWSCIPTQQGEYGEHITKKTLKKTTEECGIHTGRRAVVSSIFHYY